MVGSWGTPQKAIAAGQNETPSESLKHLPLRRSLHGTELDVNMQIPKACEKTTEQRFTIHVFYVNKSDFLFGVKQMCINCDKFLDVYKSTNFS